MIHIGYIHEFDDSDNIFREITMLESMCEILDAESRQEHLNAEFLEFMDENPASLYQENKITNLVSSLGDAVKNIIDKLVELIGKVRTFIAEKIFARKTNLQKVEALCEQNPEYAQRIRLAFKTGELDVKDIKSLNDVIDGSADILRRLDGGKIEPSEAEKRFDKLVQKYQKYGKPIVEIAAGVTTVISLIVAVKTLIPKLSNEKAQYKVTENKLKQMKLTKKLDDMDNGAVSCRMRIFGKLSKLVTNHFKGLNGISEKIAAKIDAADKQSREKMEKELKDAKRIGNKYDAIVKNHDSALELSKKTASETEKIKHRVKKSYQPEDDAHDIALTKSRSAASEEGKRETANKYRDSDLKDSIRREKKLTKARNKTQLDFEMSHRSARDAQVYRDEYQKLTARKEFDDANAPSYKEKMKAERDTAYNREMGKRAATQNSKNNP